jgi:hypothetical protein
MAWLAAAPVSAEPATFGAGSLIVPMDLAPDGQDAGMLRAYGLVYELLRHEVPVHWMIDEEKAPNGDDFTLAAEAGIGLVNLESSIAIPLPRSFRGGPFIIAAENAAEARPIIAAWQAAAGDETMVHEVTAGCFTAPQFRVLRRAPSIAILHDGNEFIAFNNLNAAGIRDQTGAPWTYYSPGVLYETNVAGLTDSGEADGALFHGPGQARYGFLVAMHYNDTEVTAEVVREVRAWLATSPLTHAFMQCAAAEVFENDPSGRFLTTAGLADDGNPAFNPVNRFPGDSQSQIDGIFEVDGGWVDSIGLRTDSTFRPGVRILFNDHLAAPMERVAMLTGNLDGDPSKGLVTYLAGHEFSVGLPVSTSPLTNGVRLFLNALLSSPAAIEELPSIANVSKTDTSFQFDISGSIGSVYQLQTSGDLNSWTDWKDVVNVTGTIPIEDALLPEGGLRFYRARLKPIE